MADQYNVELGFNQSPAELRTMAAALRQVESNQLELAAGRTAAAYMADLADEIAGQIDGEEPEAEPTADDDPIIYSIRRSDITGVVEDDPDYTGKMTPAVIAEVERQLFKMDFSDMADTIRIMIDEAISDQEGGNR